MAPKQARPDPDAIERLEELKRKTQQPPVSPEQGQGKQKSTRRRVSKKS